MTYPNTDPHHLYSQGPGKIKTTTTRAGKTDNSTRKHLSNNNLQRRFLFCEHFAGYDYRIVCIR